METFRFASILLGFWLIPTCLFSQLNVEQYLERGVSFYNDAKYELSLIEYRNALKLAPKDCRVHYEMAMSYYQLGQMSEAIKHAKLGVKEKSEVGVECSILLGNLYDASSKPKDSIKAYQKGLKQYGNYYLIWYNLGVTYMKQKEFELAENCFLKTLETKLDYAEAHYALSGLKRIEGKRTEALLPLYFFLLLQPQTELSKRAFSDIQTVWKGNASNIGAYPLEGAKKLSQADKELDFINFATDIDVGQAYSEIKIFGNKSKKLFTDLAKLDTECRNDRWTTYYIPFFSSIAESPHFETFIKYITQENSKESFDWVDKHTDEVGEFFDWLDTKD